MHYNKIHLVCFSPTHSSRIIASAIAEGTGIKNLVETDLTFVTPYETIEIEDALTIIAVPVYAGRVADIALKRLGSVRGCGTPVIPVVLYGNRDYEDALLELRDWSILHGFVPIAGAAFVGEHSYSRPDRPVAAGRPDSKDKQIAFEFGKRITGQLMQVNSLQQIPRLTVKGNYPYKAVNPRTPQAPVIIEENCTQCGYCIDICPANAIRMEARIISDAEVCIKCCACVKQCPQNARVFDTPFTDFLYNNFSVRREPEIFSV